MSVEPTQPHQPTQPVPQTPVQRPAYPQGYPQQYMPYPPALLRPTSGLAVTGFVLSLLGISLPALIFSLVAMRTTSKGIRGGHGLAVAGAIIGGIGTLVYVVIAILWIVVLVGAAGVASTQ